MHAGSTSILDAPSWDASDQNVAVLVSRQGWNFVRIYGRSHDGLEFKAEYPLNWQVGAPLFDLLPLPEPQWVGKHQVVLRAKPRGESGTTVGDLLLIDLAKKQSVVIAKQIDYYQVDPTGNHMVTQERGKPCEVLLMNLQGEIQQRIAVPNGFRVRPFFFWNGSGSRFAFQASYAAPSQSNSAPQPGMHVFVVHLKSKSADVTDHWYPQMRGGYSAHGIGWLDDDTIVFGVTERPVIPGEFNPNPAPRFVLYQSAVNKTGQRAVKVWQAETKLIPMAGVLFWLRRGGVVYPFGRERRDFAVYHPSRKVLRQVRFPEVVWNFSATFAGDIVCAVNRARNIVYWCNPEHGRLRRLQM